MKKAVIFYALLCTVGFINNMSYTMYPAKPSTYTGISPAPAKPNMPQNKNCKHCSSFINASAQVCGFCGKNQ